jgi:hypothetical protein
MWNLKDMVHIATKVESQIKRRQHTCSDQFDFIFLNMEVEFEEGTVQPKPYMHVKAEPPKPKKDAHMAGKGKSESQPTHDKEIKCFKCLGNKHIASQCPNRRV